MVWPAEYSYKAIQDNDGFPVMFWREKSKYLGAENGGINWAPRGCFVWQSKQKDQPIQFVHVNMNNTAPVGPAIMGSILFCGVVYWASLPLWNYLMWCVCWLLVPLFGIALAVPVLESIVWSGRIKPRTYLRPWASLESFATVPAPPGFAYVRADFGIELPKIWITQGAWNSFYAAEWIRELTLHFCARRPGYFDRLGLDKNGVAYR